MDPAQQSLIGALHTGFTILRILIVVLLVAYVASGSLRVDAGEQGLIVRLGRLITNPETQSAVFRQGWRWALPDPFDEKIRLPGRAATLVIDTFSFARDPADAGKPLSASEIYKDALQPGIDGAMLTGDKNLLHGIWRVEYRVVDAEQFVRTVGEDLDAVRPLLQRVAENTILREVAWRRFEDVTRGDVGALAGAVRDRLRAALEPYKLGIDIVAVAADTAEPPSVRNAYRAVLDAENQMRALEDEARREATQRLNEAAGPQYAAVLDQIRAYGALQAGDAAAEQLTQVRTAIDLALDTAGGQVATRLRGAAAQADETRSAIEAEYDLFQEWYQQYQRFPTIAGLEIWNLMRQVVIGSAYELFYVPRTQRLEILINRDPDVQKQREAEALQRGGLR